MMLVRVENKRGEPIGSLEIGKFEWRGLGFGHETVTFKWTLKIWHTSKTYSLKNCELVAKVELCIPWGPVIRLSWKERTRLERAQPKFLRPLREEIWWDFKLNKWKEHLLEISEFRGDSK